MKRFQMLLAAFAVTLVSVSCTPTSTPATTSTSEVAVSSTSTSSVVAATSVEDFTFFSGPTTEDSAVFDTKEFTNVTSTYRCEVDYVLKILVSNDGVNWLEQLNIDGGVCRQGKTESLNVSGRFYKARSNGQARVDLIGRFSR